jgi:hypothetical protein
MEYPGIPRNTPGHAYETPETRLIAKQSNVLVNCGTGRTANAIQAAAAPSGTALSLTPSARSNLNTVSMRGFEPGASVL